MARPKKPKSTRADSAHVQTSIMKDAVKGVPVPDGIELKPEHLVYWKAITDARAQWTTIDLMHAGNLARCLWSIEENTRQLDREGDVVYNAKGTQIMNPRFTVLEQLSRRAVSLSSKIQIHAGATMGEAKQAKGKNTAKRQALEAMDEVEDDDLIARPTVQ